MKRIVCVLLTLIMLLSLVPMGASAAGMEVSQTAITILKQFEKFRSDCWTGDMLVAGKPVYYTGYGTVCNKTHNEDGRHIDKNGKILSYTTEAEASEALKTALSELDAKINAFASGNGVSLTQNEHDALVIFSYDAGAGWITGSGVVRNAILEDGGVNDLLNAFANWGGGYSDRRKIEVNMYVNGVYTSSVPTGYTYVTYNANGGSLAQGDSFTYYYNTGKTIDHPVTPTRTGYKFMGWYDQPEAPTVRYDSLTKSCKEETLYALWQANNATAKNADTKATAVAFSVKASDLVQKRVYKTPDVSAKSAELKDKTVKVTKEFIDGNGQRWGYIGGTNPWVRLTGSKVAVTTDGTVAAFQVTVTVTNSHVNSRVNATASSAKNGSYKQGDQLLIIDEDGGWGQVGQIQSDGSIKAIGWVSLKYTNWNSVKNGTSDTSTNNTSVVATATVTYNGYLNIRSEANTESEIVGALAKNDTVDLYETKTVDGHQWGRCKSGWICLSYTNVTNKSGSSTAVNPGAESYIYTGKLISTDALYTDALASTATQIGKSSRPADAAEKIKVLQLKTDAEGKTWVKALWYVDKDKDKKATKEAAVTGWTSMDNFKMDAATYTVSCDELSVRHGAGNEYTSFFKLTKGVQIKVTEVVLKGESIWGKVPAHDNGWVNLSTQNVTRGDSIKVETNETADTGKVGTVINTDSLRVRKTGAAYAAQIGSLSRGTTVAIWESDDGWCKVDSNQNGTYDYEDDGWVSERYLEVGKNAAGTNSTVTDAAGNKYETDGTGKGVVANTYGGVNVRDGAGIGYAVKGKLLPGTIVDILELSSNGKWGRTAQGWVSMDYITMLSYNEALNDALTGGNGNTTGGIQVESFDKADKTTKTATFTGKIEAGVKIYNDADTNAAVLRTTAEGENITIHELATVKTVVSEEVKDQATGDKDNGTTTTVTTTETTYWARINDGWLQTTDGGIVLNALNEKVHTLTGKDELTVYDGANTKLKKGDQVKVTALMLDKDTVLGRIETVAGNAWVDLNLFSEGAVYEAPKPQAPTAPSTPVITPPTIGAGSSTGGFVTNTSGYRYTGNVIRTNELNVRSTPSTTAAKTTSLKNGQALVIYETMQAENMAWGRCDAGWVYLYYVDLVPATGAVDARVVANDNTVAYTDMNCTAVAGTYSRQSVVDIFEIVGKMARTDLGWVNVDNLL